MRERTDKTQVGEWVSQLVVEGDSREKKVVEWLSQLVVRGRERQYIGVCVGEGGGGGGDGYHRGRKV